MIACLLASIHRDPKAGGAPARPGDFFPLLDDEDGEESAEQLEARITAMALAAGAVMR